MEPSFSSPRPDVGSRRVRGSRGSAADWLVPLTPALLLGLGVWLATLLGSWAWLSGSDYVPDYSDLQQISATADCAADDPQWSLDSETCDPIGRAYNYPTLWARGFAALGLGLSKTQSVGLALTMVLLLTVVAAGLMIRRVWARSPQSSFRVPAAIVWMAACVSPPFWLALDRGNSDIIVLALVVAAAFASTRAVPVLPGLIVVLSTLLKVFAVGSGLMLLALRRSRWLTIAVGAAGSAAALLYLLDELPLISARTPRAHWMSFGVSVIPLRYQEQLGSLLGSGRGVGLLAGGLFIAGVLVVVVCLKSRFVRRQGTLLVDGIAGSQRAAVLFLAGTGAFLAAYGVGTAYDYRLMFVALSVAGLLAVRHRARVLGLWAAAILVVLMWCSAQWQVLGDLADWLWLVVAPALAVLTFAVSLRLVRTGPLST